MISKEAKKLANEIKHKRNIKKFKRCAIARENFFNAHKEAK